MILFSASAVGFYDPEIHTRIPEDAVEITADEHAALISGQALGKQIVPDADGKPTLADLVMTPQQLATAARIERDARLAATDWTQLRDVAQTTAARWSQYRQALREVPQQAGFPTAIRWPLPPQ